MPHGKQRLLIITNRDGDVVSLRAAGNTDRYAEAAYDRAVKEFSIIGNHEVRFVLEEKRSGLLEKKKAHYHVIASLYGCLPSDDPSTHTDRRSAELDLKEVVSQLRDGGNTLTGNIRTGYFQLKKKKDALVDYVELTECVQDECAPAEGDE